MKSTKFCEYLCLKVLPEWESILSTDHAKLLRALAEACAFTSKLEKADEAVKNIHTVLMEFLPEVSTTDGGSENDRALEFTKVEGLLFAFHTVAQMSSFLTDNTELFKELQVKCQRYGTVYLVRTQ